MPLTDPPLWERIRNYPLPFRVERDVGLSLSHLTDSFEACLRPIGDWTPEAAAAITEEYRRFLYLKAIDGGILTPPEVIDQAWHLHQSLGADYVERFCRRVVGRPLSHVNDLTFRERLAANARLLQLYRDQFDAAPPADIWPSVVDMNSERTAAWLFVLAAICACAGVALGEWIGRPYHGLLLLAAIIAVGAVGFYQRERPATIARCG